ncbi:MAG: hypothetical protein ABIE68_04440 [bacterium]
MSEVIAMENFICPDVIINVEAKKVLNKKKKSQAIDITSKKS